MIALLLLCTCGSHIKADSISPNVVQPPMLLHYDRPATVWMTSALPIGNGELGAMFFGGIEHEHIQFNEKTLWKGSTSSRGAYQSFGDLYIDFPEHDEVTNYRRELSLDNAIGKVSYDIDDVRYVREYFASSPDSMIIIRISTPKKKGKVTLSVCMETEHNVIQSVSSNFITFRGKFDILSYEAQACILNEGGVLISDNNRITVSNADAVTILLTAATNYTITSNDYLGESPQQLHERLSKRISNLSTKSYAELKHAHLTDYKPLFDRVKFSLDVPMPDMTTDKLVGLHTDNLYLDMLYFQYGRYLMLASSRGMNLPNNLQGIWNNNNMPPWECDIHTNINIQMNYWPAESTNLSECHLPFINYINTEALRENGSFRNLAASEGNRGWALKTQCNIFAYTDWNINRPANAWYCMHLWQHYAYTNDIIYLSKTAFPIMKATCEYWFDRLQEDPNTGKLIAPDEWSPEQGPWQDGVAYAQQLIWELFNQTLKAITVVDADPVFTAELKDKFAHLDNGLEIGSRGQIKEWKTDTEGLDNQSNQHRHLSHLIGLYPGNQISYHKDSLYADAAKITLTSRGDEGMGWSRAWKISCWARLFDGDHAYKLLKSALNLTDITIVSMNNQDGGVYENLLDAHPPFQIDGNFGATAGMSEMLIQSNMGFIRLLAALPSAWPAGSIDGLKTEGNFTLRLVWKNAKPVECSVYSGSGNRCVLYYPDIHIAKVMDNAGNRVDFEQMGKNKICFSTVKGQEYKIIFDMK